MKRTRKICPACNADCDAQSATCWLCFSRFPEVAVAEQGDAGQGDAEQGDAEQGDAEQGDAGQGEAKTPTPIRTSSSSFGLMSLMMIISLIAVCMGAMTVAPGLGILISVLATPALIRTVVESARRKEAGVAISPGEKVAMFFASLGAVITAGMVAIAVFFGTCVAACFGAMAIDSGQFSGGGMLLFWMLIGLGVLAGLASGYWILRLFWRNR